MHSSLHSWEIYLSAGEAWEAMYEASQRAERSIELEEYIFENDAEGQRFLRLFIDKAKEGVKVVVIVDLVGSSSFYGSPLVDELRRAGGRFYFYNLTNFWDLFRPWRLFPRTHVKTLLIDSAEAFVGGVCIDSRMRHWRDTQLKVSGPVVDQIRAAFDRIEVSRRSENPVCPVLRQPPAELSYLQSYPLLSWHIIYREFVRAVAHAREYVYISSPFFTPNSRFRRLLQRKARRGIDVRVLVPETSDFTLADWILLSYAAKILDSGIRLYFYRNNMLHDKTIVIDDKWATVGSTNVDALSFFRNREANLVIRNRTLIAEMKAQFFTDLKNATELTRDDLACIPWWKLAAGYAGRLVKSFI